VCAVLLALAGWGPGGRPGGGALCSSSAAARARTGDDASARTGPHGPAGGAWALLPSVRVRRAWLALRPGGGAGAGAGGIGAMRGGGGTGSEADGGEDESGRYVPGMMQHEVGAPEGLGTMRLNARGVRFTLAVLVALQDWGGEGGEQEMAAHAGGAACVRARVRAYTLSPALLTVVALRPDSCLLGRLSRGPCVLLCSQASIAF